MIFPQGVDAASGGPERTAMLRHHAALRTLCTALEECANRLPDRYALHHAATLTADLATSLRQCEALARPLFHPDGNPFVERLHQYLAADTMLAEDLHEALCSALAATPGNPAAPQAATLSYMMRGLFDGCRRCIDCQEAALILSLEGH